MALVDQFGNKIISSKAVTSGYEPAPLLMWGTRVRDLPLFTWWTVASMLMEPTIRLGLAMRAAPLCGAEFGYKENGQWVQGVECKNREVKDFLDWQIDILWTYHIHKFLAAQTWGWSAGELTYGVVERNGKKRIVIDEVLSRSAMDCLPLTKGGKLFGVRFARSTRTGDKDLQCGKAFWHAYQGTDVNTGGLFGESVLRGAYSPWADKWLNGGALDVRRLYMHADAYGGKRIYYPQGSTAIEGIGTVYNRDIAREMNEQLKSGGVVTLPGETDEKGKRLWEVEDARVGAVPTHILQYPRDLDVEILRGIEIADDVLTSENTGAWAGKQVPMTAFYQGLMQWLHSLVGMTVVPQILENLVMWNWGKPVDFSVKVKPLHVQALEQQQPPPPPMEQGMPPEAGGGMFMGNLARRMGLAEEVVERAIEGVDKSFQFASTQFDIRGPEADRVLEMAGRVEEEDLVDGREYEPHITVLYGLLTDEDDQVRHLLRDEGPIAVRIGKTTYFESQNHDVVVIEVESTGLHALHDRLRDACPNDYAFPEYRPHITLAYVKPGLGQQYAGMADLEGAVIGFDELTFSPRDGEPSYIQLSGAVTRLGCRPGERYLKEPKIRQRILTDLVNGVGRNIGLRKLSDMIMSAKANGAMPSHFRRAVGHIDSRRSSMRKSGDIMLFRCDLGGEYVIGKITSFIDAERVVMDYYDASGRRSRGTYILAGSELFPAGGRSRLSSWTQTDELKHPRDAKGRWADKGVKAVIGKKLTKDQQRWLDHIKEHWTPRGMTLGRGRPHDRRVVQSLIDKRLIKPIKKKPDVLQEDFAIREKEDRNGLAMFFDEYGTVWGADHYDVEIRPFDEKDYESENSDSSLQNGIDTAWEKYPDDKLRREWMQWAIARSTLAMYD